MHRLAMIAAEAEAGLFARHPHGAGRYAGRLICRALCQGAAQHYLDGRSGVKDFDVWSFSAARGDGPFPNRWRGTADYGLSKFGRYPGDLPSFTAAGSTCSADRSTCRSAPTRPMRCEAISPRRAPPRPARWPPRLSCSSSPSTSSERSSGPPPESSADTR